MLTKKIKIIHILPRLVAGGAEKMVLHYARLLDKNIFDVAIASTVADGPLRPLFVKENVKLFVGDCSRDGGRWAVAKKLKKFVKEFQPQIIHTHLLGGDIFGYFFKVIVKLPVYWISTQHNVEFQTSFARRLLWRHILKKADKIIAVADKVKKYDLEQFGLKENKIVVIKNGIALETLSNLPLLKAQTPWRLGIVGRLQEQKGHLYLFKALSQLLNYEWQLNIFGDGPDKEKLQQLAAEQGINERLIWHGVETDLAKLFGAVDVIIQPSLWEGLSLVVMEALAAGRLVIASAPAAAELIIDGQTGLVVKPADSQSLINKLEYIFNHQSPVKDLARQARDYAENNLAIELNVKKLAKIYLAV